MQLVFTLSGHRYALDTAWAGEVIPLGMLTRLPGAPAGVSGLLNLRGEIVAAIDLDALLDRPRQSEPAGAGAARRPWAVLVRRERVEAAFLADSVEAVEEDAPLEPTLVALEPGLASLASGTARYAGRIAVVLDVPKVLARCASGGAWQSAAEQGVDS